MSDTSGAARRYPWAAWVTLAAGLTLTLVATL